MNLSTFLFLHSTHLTPTTSVGNLSSPLSPSSLVDQQLQWPSRKEYRLFWPRIRQVLNLRYSNGLWNLPTCITLVIYEQVFWNACLLRNSNKPSLVSVSTSYYEQGDRTHPDILVSENKPVGSVQPSKEDNLLGDDVATSPTTNGANGAAAALQNNQDLLAEIFGSSAPTTSAPAAANPPPSQKSTVDDILGLFGSTAPAAAATPPPQAAAAASPVTQPAASSAFSLPQTQTPPPQPAHPKLTAYPAYDKNELRISLTPQTNPQRPGVVNILARFHVTGNTPATGLTFQAAVPKVCHLRVIRVGCIT